MKLKHFNARKKTIKLLTMFFRQKAQLLQTDRNRRAHPVFTSFHCGPAIVH